MKCGGRRIALALAALVVAAGGVTAEPASTMIGTMIGTWEIVAAAPAPWSAPERRKALQAEGNRVLHTTVMFKKNTVTSKLRPLNCKRRVLYEANAIAVDALFQGNLPEPNPTAAAIRLGFPRADVPGVDVRCLKALFTFHFRDPDTALINIHRVIYTLKRQ
jgi:hypothetical protein